MARRPRTANLTDTFNAVAGIGARRWRITTPVDVRTARARETKHPDDAKEEKKKNDDRKGSPPA